MAESNAENDRDLYVAYRADMYRCRLRERRWAAERFKQYSELLAKKHLGKEWTQEDLEKMDREAELMVLEHAAAYAAKNMEVNE